MLRLLTFLLGDIHDVSSLFQIYQRLQSAFHKSHEKHCVRNIPWRRRACVPARVRLHPTAGDPSTQQYESQDQGRSTTRLRELHPANSVSAQEAYKQVYNWQFVHCVDFWSLLLSRACQKENEIKSGEESELKALIYPLVQVAVGAIKWVRHQLFIPR